jgi:hypothetical protein
MKKIAWNALLISCSLAGCGLSDEGTSLLAAETNELGITQIEVDHGEVHGDKLLTVRGFDNTGTAVATATLRTGLVWYGADVAEDWHGGTELNIDVRGDSASFTSPDRVPHELRPSSPAIAAFTRLTAVSSAIAEEAGIRFRSATLDEVAFAATTCNGANFPTANGNPSQCCQDGVNLWHKIAAGANLNRLAWRTVNSPCRDSAGGTTCSGTGCYYGPCGAHIETVPGTNTTSATVFHPVGATTQCGRDSNGASAGGGIEAPEAYSSQSLYPGVTASCGYTACLTNGTRGNRVTNTIVAELIRIRICVGTTCYSGWSGDSVEQYITEGASVTVSAARLDGGAGIQLSGGCSAWTGIGYSVSCTVSAGSGDKAILTDAW